MIDRTFIDEAGVRWIIDYKTSDHEGSDLENFFESREGTLQGTTGALCPINVSERRAADPAGFILSAAWRMARMGAPAVLRKQALRLFEL